MEPIRRNLAELFPGWRVSDDDEKVRLLPPVSSATTLNNPTPKVPPTAKTPPDCVEKCHNNWARNGSMLTALMQAGRLIGTGQVEYIHSAFGGEPKVGEEEEGASGL